MTCDYTFLTKITCDCVSNNSLKTEVKVGGLTPETVSVSPHRAEVVAKIGVYRDQDKKII